VLQAIVRNVWLLSAMWDIRLIFEHIPGKENKIVDLLLAGALIAILQLACISI
jgi:hypothetical protein